MATMIPYNTTTPPYSTGGAPTGGSNTAYGMVPTLPNYLTDTTSTMGTDVQAQMQQNLPGYMNAMGTDMANVQAGESGQLSPGVITQLQQGAAELGIGRGMGTNTPSTNAAYLKQLGLNSYQVQQVAHSQLLQNMAATPIQQQQTTTQNTDLGALRATYAAAPNPTMAANANWRAMQQGMGAGQGATQLPQWLQQMNALQAESQHANDWFYQPVPTGAPYSNPNRTNQAPPLTGQGADMANYDPNTGTPWDTSSYQGGYGSMEGTPGFSGANDTYTNQNSSYYDPYGFDYYTDGGGE